MAPKKEETLKLQTSAGHGPGQASVAYSACQPQQGLAQEELYIATCGADGRVCVRDALLLEPEASAKVDTPPAGILAMDPKGKYLAVGDEQYVKLYKLPSLALERVACRFRLPLRGLAFSPDGARLAAGGDDNIIKIVTVKDGTVQRSLHCEEFVLSLAWDPDGTFLAASLRSGGFVLYDTTSGKLEKRLEGHCERVDYTSPRRTLPAWHPDGGSVLAVPGGPEGEVALYERLSWEAAGYLSDGHSAAVNAVAFSPNGLYAATAGQDKRVVVWDVDAATPIAAATCAAVMSGLAWAPAGNEIALVGECGGVGVWSKPVPADRPGPAVPAEELERLQRQAEVAADKRRAQDAAAGRASQGGSGLDVPAGGEVVVEEVVEEVAAAAAPEPSGGGGGGGTAAEAGAEDEGSGAGRRAGGAGAEGGAGPAGAEDAGGGGRRRAAAAAPRAAPVTTTVRTVVRTIVGPPAGPAPQPAFQPGATPAAPGRSRFLCYSLLGCVVSKPVDDHAVVEVTFHDASRHGGRVPLLTDYFGFDRATMCDRGVLYASPPSGTPGGGAQKDGAPERDSNSGGVPSMLMFRPFDAWAPHSEWTAPLPAGEQALCLAAGSSFLAAATSAHLLRLFSLAGSQTLVARLDGAPVAAAASGAWLAVAWHAGAPNPHTRSQCLWLSLFDTAALACVASGPLPLSPGATLAWLGFTDDHALPAAVDSEGAVAVRTPDFGGRWVPVFSPPASRRSVEALWPVGLTAKQLFAIVCKAAEPHPQVSPRPFYTPLDLAPPVLALDGGAPELEATALLQGLANAGLRARYDAAEAAGAVEEAAELNHALLAGQAEQDRALLKALQRVLRADRHARALELVAQLNMHRSLEGALQLANHHQARALAERIGAFITSRQAMLDAAAAMAAPPPEGDAYGGGYGGQHHQPQQQQQQRSYTPIPYGKRAAADADAHHHPDAAAAAGTQPLAPADLNARPHPTPAAAGGLTPFADLVAAAAPPPGSAGGGLSTGPKSAGGGGPRGLPTPNTLLAAATAKPEGGGDHKRKPPSAHDNPFARKAPKLGK